MTKTPVPPSVHMLIEMQKECQRVAKELHRLSRSMACYELELLAIDLDVTAHGIGGAVKGLKGKS